MPPQQAHKPPSNGFLPLLCGGFFFWRATTKRGHLALRLAAKCGHFARETDPVVHVLSTGHRGIPYCPPPDPILHTRETTCRDGLAAPSPRHSDLPHRGQCLSNAQAMHGLLALHGVTWRYATPKAGWGIEGVSIGYPGRPPRGRTSAVLASFVRGANALAVPHSENHFRQVKDWRGLPPIRG